MNSATRVVNPSGRITRAITTKRTISTENLQEYHPDGKDDRFPQAKASSPPVKGDHQICDGLAQGGESTRKTNKTSSWETPSATSKIGGTTNGDGNRENMEEYERAADIRLSQWV
jgi:hypothetical protein